MKVKYIYASYYSDPGHWDKRTPLWIGMPKLFNLYLDLNDNKLRRFLTNQKGKTLDAGCGDGRFLSYADVGVDFSEGMIQRAKKRGKMLVVASILNLPFREKVFTTAFTVDVILHIEESKHDQVFKELQRVAKTSYVFLPHQRTYIHLITQFLRNCPIKSRRIVPYVVLLLAFPFDRIKKLSLLSLS